MGLPKQPRLSFGRASPDFRCECVDFSPTLEGYLNRVHPDDRDCTRRTIEEALAKRKPFAFEERIIRGDGESRLLYSQGRRVFDQAGEPVRLMGICQDITERKQREEQLRRSEERFQFVARATNDAIWDWDLVSDRVWWNQGITTLFHYVAEDVGAEANWGRARVHPDDLGRVTAAIKAILEKGEQFWSAEYRFRRADGPRRYYGPRLCDDDAGRKPLRLIGAMTDITERKRALEILEQRVAERTLELEVRNSERSAKSASVRTSSNFCADGMRSSSHLPILSPMT